MATAKSLEDAVNELMKDYEKAAKKAAEYATEQIKEDMYSKALESLERYYYNYTSIEHKPKRYDRTDSLKDSFVPFSSISSKNNKISCSMGIEYDYDRLNGSYNKVRSEKYNSWNPPESEWIVDNYLSGIHPTTNGKRVPEEVKYIPIQDTYSPSFYMEGYIDTGIKRFNNYMMISFLDQITKMK